MTLECHRCRTRFDPSQQQQLRASRGQNVVCSLACRARNGTNFRHGHTSKNEADSPTYQSWHAMLERCRNPNTRKFSRYGGRGILVCDRWQAFSNFLADMGERPGGTSIDRWPDGDGNYEPGNCRWATPKQQGTNTSWCLSIVIGGEQLTIEHAAERLGIQRNQIYRQAHKRQLSHQEVVDRYLAIRAAVPPLPPTGSCAHCGRTFLLRCEQQRRRARRNLLVACSNECRAIINLHREKIAA